MTPTTVDMPHDYTNARYQAWDMLEGRLHPELGGAPEYLDIVGVNYYPWNQWVYTGEHDAGPRIFPDDPRYIPLAQLTGSVSPLPTSTTYKRNECRG